MLARVDALRGAGGAGDARAWAARSTPSAGRWCAPTPRRSACRASPTVLDAGDAADLLDLVREEAGRGHDAAAAAPRKRTLLDIYSRTVNAQRPLSEVVAEAFPWCADARRRAGRRCSARTRRASARSGCSTSTTCCSTGARSRCTRWSAPLLAARFDHVLVDEYQDVNGLQADIVDALAREHRAADLRRRRPAGDLRLPGRQRRSTCWPSASAIPTPRVVTLEQNYRSTAPILASGERRRARRRARRIRARCAPTTPDGERAGARVVRRRGAPGRRRRRPRAGRPRGRRRAAAAGGADARVAATPRCWSSS